MDPDDLLMTDFPVICSVTTPLTDRTKIEPDISRTYSRDFCIELHASKSQTTPRNLWATLSPDWGSRLELHGPWKLIKSYLYWKGDSKMIGVQIGVR